MNYNFMIFKKHMFLKKIFSLIICFTLFACATPPTGTDDLIRYNEINDPLEPLNRTVFKFNQIFDKIIFEPATVIYNLAVPQFSQNIVTNFIRFLNTPVILMNDILQANGRAASDSLSRLMLNSMVFGLFDLANDAGIEYHDEDFGQTLAGWGVSEGPYLVLPILGSKTVRSAVGGIVDSNFDPLTIYAKNTDNHWINWTKIAIDNLNWRAGKLEQIKDLKKSSLDFYAETRILYRQNRQNMINSNKKTIENNGLEDYVDAMGAKLN